MISPLHRGPRYPLARFGRYRRWVWGLLFGCVLFLIIDTIMLLAVPLWVSDTLQVLVDVAELTLLGLLIVTLLRGTMQLGEVQNRLLFQGRLLDAVEQAVIVTDVRGRIVYWNRFAETLYGWKEAEVLGRTITRITVPDTNARDAEEILSCLRAGESWSGEFLLRRKDGSQFSGSVMDYPVLDDNGNLIGIIGISTDITVRKEAEKALRETSLLIEKTFVSLSDAIFVVDRDTRTIKMCNAAAVSMFGYPAEELIGFSSRRLHLNDDSFNEFGRMLMRAIDQGKPLHGEYQMRRRNGELFPIEYVVAPLDRESGNASDIVSVIRDITARKRAEDELRASRQALRALARDLQSAREGERERVAREIHDELGQQLTAIRMDLDTLRSRLPAGNDRLRGMIDEMISISDATVGTVRRIATELRPAILDDLGLPAAVEWLAEDFERRSGIECRVEVHSDSLHVGPDQAVALFRIVQEALTNVARHSQASHTEVLLEITHDRAIAVVRDDGRGVRSEELRERRALGILGMRERALAVGGTFDVLGKSGCGTTVRVDIPRAEERSVHDSSHHRR